VAVKSEVPGGLALLSTCGYIYTQEAKKKLGRFFGIESFVESVRETG